MMPSISLCLSLTLQTNRPQMSSNDSAAANALVALADPRAVRQVGSSDGKSLKRSAPPSDSSDGDRERVDDSGGGGGGGGGPTASSMSKPLQVDRCTGSTAGGTFCYCRLTRTELKAYGLWVCADCTHPVGHHSEPMASLMSLRSAIFQQQPLTQPVRTPSSHSTCDHLYGC